MNTALSWIKAYVPELKCSDQEYCDAMTLSGTKVEGYERLDKNLEKIVVGQIEKIEKHPDADKLIVCQVNVGTEVIQIVTGAPNVKEGDKVPVVLDGGKVAGGHDGGPLPEAARRVFLWDDVFHRRVGNYQGNVSGGAGVRDLYFRRRCPGGQRCGGSIGA